MTDRDSSQPRTPSGADFPRPEGLDRDLEFQGRDALRSIRRKVILGDSLEDILDFLFTETSSIMPCDRLGLAFLEEGGRRVTAHYVRADYEPLHLDRGYSLDLEATSLKRVLDSGVPRVIGDLKLYEFAHPQSESTKLLLREGVRASLTIPLVIRGNPLGFLFRSSRFPDVYKEREVQIQQNLVTELGPLVEKAHRIEQLEAANRAYMEILGFVSHELKSPLAGLISEGKLLTGSYLGDMDPRQKGMVEQMTAKAEYLLNLTREYLDLARIEGGTLHPNLEEEADLLVDLVNPALELCRPMIRERSMALAVDIPRKSARILGDSDLLKIVLVNLLGNAAKFGKQGARISFAVRAEEDRLTASVWNEGPGFREAEKARLFRRFSRLKTPEHKGIRGSGVGLYTSWWIVKLHGGRIWAESEYGNWARFSFEIPQPPVPPPFPPGE